MSESELTGYLDFVGFDGFPAPTITTLTKLITHHLCAIPYENLDPILGRPVPLDFPSILAKLTSGCRGGYCFEQNGLFAEILEALGFDVRVLSARPRISIPRIQPAPMVHPILLVHLDGEQWLVDVGAAGLTPAAPIRWVENIEQETPHDNRRIVRDGDRWFQQIYFQGEWKDTVEFSGQEMPQPDREIVNYYTSRHPESPFRKNALCSRILPNGERLTLSNCQFTRRGKEGVLETFPVANATLLQSVLKNAFGIKLPSGVELPEPRLDYDNTNR